MSYRRGARDVEGKEMRDRNWKEATDGELLAAFRRDRRDEAFGELVRRHLPLVHGVALRRLGSAALAEEAVQLVFLRLVEKSAEVSAVMPELAWTAGSRHYHSRFPPLTLDEAERVVAGLLAPCGGDGGGGPSRRSACWRSAIRTMP